MSNIPIQHRLKVKSAPIKLALKQHAADLRVAIPGIVVLNRNNQTFDPALQTVSVQPAITEIMLSSGTPTLVQLPVLDDVPVVMPRAGGWALTFPIALGDECLLVFADMAIDHWWESGGVQRQPEGKLYRHDIGDAFAIFGVSSNPRALANYSTTNVELRSEDGATRVSLTDGRISLQAGVVDIAVETPGSNPPVQPIMTQAYLTWFTTYVLPHITLPAGTPPPPVNSVTTVLQAE